MTHVPRMLRPIRWPAQAGAALLALSTAAASAGAPAPLSPSLPASATSAPVLFRYEELFGRSSGEAKPFGQIDLDGDRILSPEELQHAFGSRWKGVLSRLDRDADGQVSREEAQSFGKPSGEQSKDRRERDIGAQPDKPAGARGNSQSAERGRSNSGKAGSRGEEKGNRGGNGSGSRGNGGGNKSASGGKGGRD